MRNPTKHIKQVYFGSKINPVEFWKPAIARFLETGCERVYFSDHLVYSNQIYARLRETTHRKVYFGPLDSFVVGQILKYLEYEEVMTTVRYLCKSFIQYTQNKCHYIEDIKKKAQMRVSLNEVYNGSAMMPIVNHPYYTNCSQLKLVFQICSKVINDPKKTKELLSQFMNDLFSKSVLFPNLKNLKIIFCHSYK